jgi:hypothetical protein
METETANPAIELPHIAQAPPSVAPPGGPIRPSPMPGSCPTCTGGLPVGPPSYVYALGRIEPLFPRLSVEKEYAQVVGRANTKGKTDKETLHSVLSKPENRYLARQLCWVMTIEGLETYILTTRASTDIDLLVESLRASPDPMDVDVIIGVKGPMAPSDVCNGLMLPIVGCDQIYSFDRDTLLKSVPRPKGATDDEFGKTTQDVFDQILQTADNAGATDEHRALNYAAVRFPGFYLKTFEMFSAGFSLTAIDVRPSRLATARKIVDVVFAYTNRQTWFTEQWFARFDVTEEFPFLVSPLARYFER